MDYFQTGQRPPEAEFLRNGNANTESLRQDMRAQLATLETRILTELRAEIARVRQQLDTIQGLVVDANAKLDRIKTQLQEMERHIINNQIASAALVMGTIHWH